MSSDIKQQFEGIIIEVLENTVFAELHDLTGWTKPYETIEIPIRHFGSNKIKSGTIFYWDIFNIGFEIRVKEDIWTEADIAKAKIKARKIYERFG